MQRRGQTMWAALLMLLVVTLGGARRGYAGAGGIGPGSKVIPQPQLRGELSLMYDLPNNQVAAVITGLCKGRPFLLGPVVFDLPKDSLFEDLTRESNLEGFFISRIDFPNHVDVPAGCFSPEDTLQGLVIQDVLRYSFTHPRMVIAEVVVLGVRPPL